MIGRSEYIEPMINLFNEKDLIIHYKVGDQVLVKGRGYPPYVAIIQEVNPQMIRMLHGDNKEEYQVVIVYKIRVPDTGREVDPIITIAQDELMPATEIGVLLYG